MNHHSLSPCSVGETAVHLGGKPAGRRSYRLGSSNRFRGPVGTLAIRVAACRVLLGGSILGKQIIQPVRPREAPRCCNLWGKLHEEKQAGSAVRGAGPAGPNLAMRACTV